MARGLDLGSANAVVATRSGAGPAFTRARSIYVALAAGRRTEASLREAGLRAIPWNGRILVLGDEAARVALMQGSPDDLRQPLANGLVQRGDAEGEQVLALLAGQLLGPPATKGEHLGLTMPPNADDHHRRVLTQLGERLGFRPVLVPQPLAVLLAEADLATGLAGLSGLALSFGAAGIHAALVHGGALLFATTFPQGGRAIDARVARETGFPPPKVAFRKEQKFTFLAASDDPVLAGVRRHADAALQGLCAHLDEAARAARVELGAPIECVAAGGLAAAPGFAAWLKDGLARHGAPVGIRGVRVAADPTAAAAAGALVAALAAEGAAAGSADPLERRASAWRQAQGRAVEPPPPTRPRRGTLIDPREDKRAQQVLIEPGRIRTAITTKPAARPPAPPPPPPPTPPVPRPAPRPRPADVVVEAAEAAAPEPTVVFDAGAEGAAFDGIEDVPIAAIEAMPDDVEVRAASVAVSEAGGDVEPLDVQRLLGAGRGQSRPAPGARPAVPPPRPAAGGGEGDAAGNLTEMLRALWGRVRKLEATAEEVEAEKKAELARARLERGDARTIDVPEKFKRFFQKMVHDQASDLFVSAGQRAALRVDGRVKFVTSDLCSADFARAMFESLLGVSATIAFAKRKGLDFAFAIPKIGRFRANLFHQRGELGGVFRHIKDKVPSFEELSLPGKQLMRLAKLQRGLVLVTGIAGSGKSTTLAGMIEFINETMHRHVITIEDPIEFVYSEKLSVIDQREVGLDTSSFSRALKSAVRQSPDVILVGEMRDRDTMEAAIQAAETGHLVFSTLHTVNAQQTVERIITYFPPHQHDLLRLQLSMVLAGVISQRLLPKREGGGRVPAVELMLTTPTIKDLVYEGKTRELYAAMQEDTYFGNQTFNESLKRLYQAGVISLEEAMAAADNPDELKLEIRGISRGTKSSELDLQY